jgi:FkbM family methyltransferase
MTVYAKTIDGITFSYVNEREFLEMYNEIFRVHQYRFSTASPTPFIIDCGANIGLAVLYFKKVYPSARILAFEPNPTTFQLLEKNISQNNLKDVELVNAAVSNAQGTMDFYISEDEGLPWASRDTGIRRTTQGSWETITVPSVQLSSYINQRVDFLKLDIEGMEEMVLREIEDKLHFMREIRLEFHDHGEIMTNTLDSIADILQRNHFQFALEHERQIVQFKHAREASRKTNPYLLMIYTHRQRSSLWWQAWFMPKIMRVQNRLMKPILFY